MKKKIKAISTKALVLTFGIGTLVSCISDPDSPGLEFMPDMYRSPAIETYVDYGFVKDRTNKELTMTASAKHPPVHTIPYHGKVEDLEMYLPYHRQANSFAPVTHGLQAKHGWNLSSEAGGDYFKAAEDRNPIKLTDENEKAIFSKGKKLFDINCAHCHGTKGDGKGPMVESGAYMGVPDFNNLKDLSDGQVFFSIYYGKGMMGAHASLLKNNEIWTIVHHINKLRLDDYGVGSVMEETVSESVEEEETEQ
ncbi:MAG TPA: c-type cytochrome [Brumimicrobium sp.]|nr:c-type cytochrome [Brumimicrobium sp.]